MTQDPIGDAFRPLRDLPCWDVQRGYGSFVTLQFGLPRVELREPYEGKPTQSAKVRRHRARRNVWLRGEWQLWVYCCYWNFFQRNELIGKSDTKKSIDLATQEMQGQKIVRVEAGYLPGHSVFEFDLGGRLTTRPYLIRRGEPDTHWMLFEPGGNVLSYREDDYYSYQSGDTKPDEKEWLPLPAPGLSLQTYP